MSIVETHHGARKRWRIGAAIVVLATVPLICALVIFPQPGAWPEDDLPPPHPNGYADLIQAGHSIAGPVPGPNGDYKNASAAELRQWVDDNQAALEAARAGVRRECRVVLPPSNKGLQQHLDDTGSLRQLCRLFAAQARLAKLEGRWDNVVQASIDGMEVANQGTRGGLMIDTLTGLASEWYGLSVLAHERNQLTAEQCRRAISALTAINDRREPTPRIAARDATWSNKSAGFYTRAALALSPSAQKLTQLSVKSMDASRVRSDARLRLAIVSLGLRLYRLDHGTDAPSLHALVPTYLSGIPADPFSRQPLCYREVSAGGGYRLYSVGPDRIDDGGKPFPERSDWNTVRGDVLVEPQ
jgi:hypothetical protein